MVSSVSLHVGYMNSHKCKTVKLKSFQRVSARRLYEFSIGSTSQ